MENKTVKIILFIVLVIIIIAIIVLMGIYNKEIAEAAQELIGQTTLKTTEKVEVVPTMSENLAENTLWCGTFQLIWNDLKNDIAKQNIIFSPQLSIADHLNKEEFNVSMISDEFFYKKVGTPSPELKKEIEMAIKEKFNENSNILNEFNWDQNNGYFLYTMLKKKFEFNQQFDELEKGKFADKYENVSYFGIDQDTKKEARNQVDVLYYNSKDDLAIKIRTKQNDEVILCKNQEGKTFNEIYAKIQKTNYSGKLNLSDAEDLKIPNIIIKEKKEFSDIANREFSLSTGEITKIDMAIQTIEFKLDKKGGEIKSEAGLTMTTGIELEEEKREFCFDSPFTLFLREEGKEKPYFAAKISDITKFQ